MASSTPASLVVSRGAASLVPTRLTQIPRTQVRCPDSAHIGGFVDAHFVVVSQDHNVVSKLTGVVVQSGLLSSTSWCTCGRRPPTRKSQATRIRSNAENEPTQCAVKCRFIAPVLRRSLLSLAGTRCGSCVQAQGFAACRRKHRQSPRTAPRTR